MTISSAISVAQVVAAIEPAKSRLMLPLISLGKALSVTRRHGEIVLGVDTIVALDGRIYGQPADEAQARGAVLGPLHGLPVVHKDLHDTAGVRTTYGSPLFADHVPAKSHPLVERIERIERHRDGQVEHAGIRRGRQHLQRGLRQDAQSLEHLAHLRRLDRRRLGLGGVERIAGIGVEDARLKANARVTRPAPQPISSTRISFGSRP